MRPYEPKALLRMSNKPRSHIDMLLDQTLSVAERVGAARCLGDLNAEEALAALLDVAQNASEDDVVSRSAGESLARILVRRAAIAGAPLHSFTGPAYLGFDDAVTSHPRMTGMSLNERTPDATAQ